MLDPHTVPYVCAKASVPTLEPQEYTQDPFAQRAGAWTPFQHVDAFVKERGADWRVIGVQSCGDLTMNSWHMAYIQTSHLRAQKQTLCGLLTEGSPQEPYHSRIYRCLVKWSDEAALARGSRHYEMIDLRFCAIPDGYEVIVEEASNSGEIAESFAKLDPKLAHSENIAAHIEFALSGKVIIERSEHLSLLSEIDKFDDLRHVLELVRVQATGYYERQSIVEINFGEYELFQDLNVRRAALSGPIILDLETENFSVSWEHLRKELLNKHFRQVSTTPTRPGEFRSYPGLIGKKKVEIFLRPSIYPFGALGLEETGGIIGLAAGGLSGRIGNTLSAVSQMMFDHFRCDDAIVLDEGLDTFQLINPIEVGGHKYTNEEMIQRIYWMSHDLWHHDDQESTRSRWRKSLSDYELNKRLVRDFAKEEKKRARVDYADIINVRPERSQIRAVLIFAERESGG